MYYQLTIFSDLTPKYTPTNKNKSATQHSLAQLAKRRHCHAFRPTTYSPEISSTIYERKWLFSAEAAESGS